MARRITETKSDGGGGKISYQDPYDQPAFTVYTQHDSGASGFYSYTHRFDRHSFTFGSNDGYGMYRTYSSHSPEFFNDNAGTTYFQTNGHPHSHNDYPSMTCCVGYLGHEYFNRVGTNSANGGMIMQTRGANYMSHAFTSVNSIVNETKQDWAWYSDDVNNSRTRTYFMPRSMQHYRQYSHGFGYAKGTFLDIPCKWQNSGAGSSCYNRKMQKMVVMEQNGGSYTWRPVIWHGVPNLRAIALNENIHYDDNDQYNGISRDNSSLKQWMNDANNAGGGQAWSSSLGYTEYQNASGKPSNHGWEDQYRCMPVLCDNGRVLMFQMIPHSGAWIHRWDENGSPSGNMRHWSGTTSYGREQGERFGMRWQVTSDGRYITGYCPYYYYGSGWLGCFIRVSDGKWLWDQSTDTSYGCQIAPIGKSSFMMMRCYNTDGGYGMYYTLQNMDECFAEVSDGGRINPHGNHFFTGESHSCIDTPYWSTSYPAIIPAMYNTHAFTEHVEGGRGTIEGAAKQTEFTTYT